MNDFGKGPDEPFAVHKTYTLSLSEKSNLRGDLETWRGRPFTDAELQSFDVAKVIGVPCMVTVAHVEKKGKVYANVTAVVAAPKELPIPPAINPPLEYSIADHNEAVFASLPQFIRDMIEASDEWKSRGKASANIDPVVRHGADSQEDDIPF